MSDGLRWSDAQPFRRLMLARYSFLKKGWHPHALWTARLNALWWTLARGHETEICGRCGGPVRIVFHVPDALWAQHSGFPGAERSPGGESGNGVLCPACFDALFYADAERRGVMLHWTCSTDEGVMIG